MSDVEICPNCQGPLSEGVCPACTSVRSFQIIQREMVLLVVIAIVAAPLYYLTRRIAEINRRRNAGIARSWYTQGQQELKSGDADRAIGLLRQAVTNDRDNTQFAFTLAQALRAARHDDEARFALLRLREAAPENPYINLELARLSSHRRDLTDALRYYHHAVYGLWAGPQSDDARRSVRLELVRLLLDRKERSRALAELLVMSSDAPMTSASQVQIARLFMEAGDPSRALQHFNNAANVDVTNFAALAGAGEAAFETGDYGTADKFLARADAQKKGDEHVAALLEISQLIRTADPLSPHLSRNEQASRVTAALEQAARRLETCVANESPSEWALLQTEVQSMVPRITVANLRDDPELLRSASELVFGAEESTRTPCGPPERFDRALLLIGHLHGDARR